MGHGLGILSVTQLLSHLTYRWACEKHNIRAEPIEDRGERRYKITDVFGIEDVRYKMTVLSGCAALLHSFFKF